MNKLGKTENRVFEAVVESVDKHQDMPFGHIFDEPREGSDCCLTVDDIGFESYEIRRWIAGNLPWPLDFTDLARTVGRNRHDDVREARSGTARARKHFGWRIGPHARGCHHHLDLARAR